MGFLNPLALIGLLSASIPFIIYLWFRRRARRIDFSAFRFLLEAQRRAVKRLRLRQLIVLILRGLTLAFVALAISRPVTEGFVPAGRGQTACVIVLDNSYSMGYEGIRGRWFDIAKRKALEVINSLGEGSLASLILASDRPILRIPSLTSKLGDVRMEIQNARLSYRSTSLIGAIELADQLLSRSPLPNGEIYLITDMRRNGWREILGGGRLRVRSSLYIIPVSDESPDNVAIVSLSFDRRIIPVGMPATLEVRLRNFSDAPVEGMVLELWVDGRKRRQVTVSIPAESEGVERIALSFDSPGYHFGWVKISGDRLPADNVRYFAVHIGGGIKTLCIGRENTYLTYALNPSLGLISGGSQAFIPVSLTPERFESALDQIDLEGYDLVALNGLFGMSDVAAAKLVDYVENGGKLLVMLDGGEAPEGLRELLPALPIGDRRHDPPLKLGKLDPGHPALKPFREEMLRGQGGPNFFATRSLKLREGARVAMRFEDGSPAMVEREVGMGRVILFNGSAYDLDRTDLPLKPLFLPLIHQLALYLCRPSGPLELGVGEAGKLSMSGSAARISSVSDPKGFAPITLPVEGAVSYTHLTLPTTERV